MIRRSWMERTMWTAKSSCPQVPPRPPENRAELLCSPLCLSAGDRLWWVRLWPQVWSPSGCQSSLAPQRTRKLSTSVFSFQSLLYRLNEKCVKITCHATDCGAQYVLMTISFPGVTPCPLVTPPTPVPLPLFCLSLPSLLPFLSCPCPSL